MARALAPLIRLLVVIPLFSPNFPTIADEKAAPLVTIERGRLPIILSSPHGGRTGIPGAKPREAVNGAVLVRDDNTAELTALLADAIERELGARPYVVIARFQRKFVDANRAAVEAYGDPAAAPHYDAFHAALTSACDDVRAKWGRGLLLDVHGQAGAPKTIIRGTGDGQTVADLLKRGGLAALIGPDSVLGRLKRAGYAIEPDVPDAVGHETRFNGGYIVRTYGSHRGTAVDAIQLELGGELRGKARLPQTAKDIAAAVAAFARVHLPGKELPNTRPASR
jgi:N-formylglutamate amidohydrolase